MLSAELAKQVALGMAMAEESLRAKQVDGPMSENTARLLEGAAAVIAAAGGNSVNVLVDRLLIVKLPASRGGHSEIRSLSAEQVRAYRQLGAESWTAQEVLDRFTVTELGQGEADSQASP